MNYTELTQAIKDYCENDETTFVNNIPVFVKNAEKYIYNNVRLPAFRKNSTANATASNKYLATPTDFLSVFELAVIKTDGLYEYLLPKDVSYIRQNYQTLHTLHYLSIMRCLKTIDLYWDQRQMRHIQ